jgi:high-affinity iron transporter
MRRAPTASPTLRLSLVTLLAVGFAVLATADATPAQEPDAQLIEQGKAIYTDQCESCHGAEGKGDGAAARFLQPPPRDLSAGEFQHATDGTVEAVAAVIKAGIDDTGMTPFEGQLSDDQITAVATYVVHVLVQAGGTTR